MHATWGSLPNVILLGDELSHEHALEAEAGKFAAAAVRTILSFVPSNPPWTIRKCADDNM